MYFRIKRKNTENEIVKVQPKQKPPIRHCTSQVNKVVTLFSMLYMPSEQVEFYQRAMNSPGFIDWATGEFIGVITAKGAEKIAAYLGIEASSTIWLIGLPISATFYILQNLEQWDLNDAIDRSTTGKVKLEFFYLTSSSAPYYQEYENFEPWNSDFVDIPADYTYSYASGEYNYD